MARLRHASGRGCCAASRLPAYWPGEGRAETRSNDGWAFINSLTWRAEGSAAAELLGVERLPDHDPCLPARNGELQPHAAHSGKRHDDGRGLLHVLTQTSTVAVPRRLHYSVQSCVPLVRTLALAYIHTAPTIQCRHRQRIVDLGTTPTMGLLSILPASFSGVETWITRLFVSSQICRLSVIGAYEVPSSS